MSKACKEKNIIADFHECLWILASSGLSFRTFHVFPDNVIQPAIRDNLEIQLSPRNCFFLCEWILEQDIG